MSLTSFVHALEATIQSEILVGCQEFVDHVAVFDLLPSVEAFLFQDILKRASSLDLVDI